MHVMPCKVLLSYIMMCKSSRGSNHVLVITSSVVRLKTVFLVVSILSEGLGRANA